MPDTTADPSWTTEQLAAAQEAAVRWAGEAERNALDATIKEDYTNDRAGSDYLRQAIAQARQEATALRARSAEASRLAEMWARVACALSARPGGQPAAYDLTVQLDPTLDPKHVGEDIVRQLRDLQRGRPGPGTG